MTFFQLSIIFLLSLKKCCGALINDWTIDNIIFVHDLWWYLLSSRPTINSCALFIIFAKLYPFTKKFLNLTFKPRRFCVPVKDLVVSNYKYNFNANGFIYNEYAMHYGDLRYHPTNPEVKERWELRHVKSLVNAYSTMKKIIP